MASENPTETPRPPLQDELVLVTGGARRVGQAIVRELARAGAQVAIHCHRSVPEAEALAEELDNGQGNKSFVLVADLRIPGAAARLMTKAAGRTATGRVACLVNNAGSFQRTPFRQMTDEAWREELALNLDAPQRCIRHALDHGLRAVVNIVDVAAWQPWANYAAYSVSKAGLLQLTRVLARELAPKVRVNAVAPGTVLFPDNLDEDARRRLRDLVPLGQEGSPEDVARAVRYLLCEPYLTGVCLPVDGGLGLR